MISCDGQNDKQVFMLCNVFLTPLTRHTPSSSFIYKSDKGPVTIYGGGEGRCRRQNGCVDKILSIILLLLKLKVG